MPYPLAEHACTPARALGGYWRADVTDWYTSVSTGCYAGG